MADELLFSALAADLFRPTLLRAPLRQTIGKILWLIDWLEQQPLPDSVRAGERLLVHARVDAGVRGLTRWRFLVLGDSSGREYGGLLLLVADGDELPLEYLGLALQVALNGPELTSADEQRALQELQLRFVSGVGRQF